MNLNTINDGSHDRWKTRSRILDVCWWCRFLSLYLQQLLLVCSDCDLQHTNVKWTGMISEMMFVMCSKVNMLDWKFCLHADYIEITIFRAYGTPLQHKCAYSKTNMKMLQAACNDAFGILLPRWTNVCVCQLIDSVAIVVLTVPTLSDKILLLLLKSLSQLHVSVLFNDYCIWVVFFFIFYFFFKHWAEL